MDISTKIICTIGPKVGSKEKIIELMQAGMNVARINLSHGTQEEHLRVINNLKKAREDLNRSLAIMLDTKGPEVRVEKVINDQLELKSKDHIKLVKKISKNDEIQISPFSIVKFLKPNMEVLFDDGYIVAKVISNDEECILQVKNAGVLKSNKRVSVPECSLNLPAMTEKDIEDIKFGCAQDIDIIAASFIRSAEHVLEIKKLLFEQNRAEILVIAKIENKEGLENFDSILEIADGIMVARGDLGVELELSQVPKYQKMMIKKCAHNFKPVVIATQMLESMIINPRPTRAEVSDVANAIYDAASSVMLSAETAVGQYPIETVNRMKSIIKETESDFDNFGYFSKESEDVTCSISSAVLTAAVKTAYGSNAKGFFVFTSSGFTVRLISRWHPKMPIFALTNNLKTYHQLSFYWGVIPVYAKNCCNAESAFMILSNYVLENRLASFGDLIVVTAGVPFGRKGSTNLIMLDSIGHIIVRGSNGYGRKIEGTIKIIRKSDEDEKSSLNKIVIIPRCDETYTNLLKNAVGIILQNTGDIASEKFAIDFAKKYSKSLIVQAENAMTLLKDGENIILDPEKSLVYFPMCKVERKKDG